MTPVDGESVLSRWSRRKLEAEQATEGTGVTETDSANDAPLDVAEVDTAGSPVLTDEDMPAIDTLNEDSDYSGFMSGGVSDELRNLALRKLFRAPVFNIRDGLDEYDEDYTEFEKLGDIVTSDMKHRIEMQEKKRLEKLAEEGGAGIETEVEDIEDEDIQEEGIQGIQGKEIVDEVEPEQEIEMQTDSSTDPVGKVKATDE